MTPDGGTFPLERGAPRRRRADAARSRTASSTKTTAVRITTRATVRSATRPIAGEAQFRTRNDAGRRRDDRRPPRRHAVARRAVPCVPAVWAPPSGTACSTSSSSGCWSLFVALAALLGARSRARSASAARTRGPAAWGNPLGFSVDTIVTLMLFIGATIYGLCYIPYFGLGHNFARPRLAAAADVHLPCRHGRQSDAPVLLEVVAVADPADSDLVLLSRLPHRRRRRDSGSACCVAEILALPNPLTWWFGLFSVPFMGWIAWREKHKGFTLLVRRLFLAVAAVDHVAAHHVRVPLLSEPRDHHAGRHVAAARAYGSWARGSSMASIGTGSASARFWSSSLASFVFFYPVVGRLARHLRSVERAHADGHRGQQLDQSAPREIRRCRDIRSGTTSN